MPVNLDHIIMFLCFYVLCGFFEFYCRIENKNKNKRQKSDCWL